MYTINGCIELRLSYNKNQNSLLTIIEDNGESRPKDTFEFMLQDNLNTEVEGL